MELLLIMLLLSANYPTVNNQRLILPLEGVSEVDHDYHQRRGRKIHGAIDQYAPIGTPVRVVADGVVVNIHDMQTYMHESNKILRRMFGVKAKNWPKAKQRMQQCGFTRRIRYKSRGDWIAGVYVSVEHYSDDGKLFKTQYMHLSEVFVKVGDKIKQGHVLGKSGDTGIVDSLPHLHFQILQDKKRVDPREYIFALDGKYLTKIKKILFKTY